MTEQQRELGKLFEVLPRAPQSYPAQVTPTEYSGKQNPTPSLGSLQATGENWACAHKSTKLVQDQGLRWLKDKDDTEDQKSIWAFLQVDNCLQSLSLT